MSNVAGEIFKHAKLHGDALAIVDKTLARYQATRSALMADWGYAKEAVTYREFTHRSRSLANGLKSLSGMAPGAPVVICLENRPEFLDLLLASWCADLCVVPINAKLHPKEVVHIVSDCAAALLVMDGALSREVMVLLGSSLPALNLVVVGSDAYARLYQTPVTESVDLAIDGQSNELAWIFYTSGTTGRPKGAMLTHQNLLAMSVIYTADIEAVSPGDYQLHAAALSHGSGLYSIPHLLGGGAQVILDGFEPDTILEALGVLKNVTFFAAPTMVMRLVAALQKGQDVSGLRTLVYGGGPMYVSDLQRALACLGPKLYQLYGQGESPMSITGLTPKDHVGDQGEAHIARLSSCGTPRTGVELRVVDDQGFDVPQGEMGEVITRNPTIMSGYWNNPPATSQALRHGWLWTGDMGRLDEHGYLTLLDRSKDLIISGGSNIYPREIEEVLLRHPLILECSVIGESHPDWGEQVVAFIVVQAGQALDAHELDKLCLDNIARFKRPKVYKIVDALPKNNYGKVLKTELRQVLQRERDHA